MVFMNSALVERANYVELPSNSATGTSSSSSFTSDPINNTPSSLLFSVSSSLLLSRTSVLRMLKEINTKVNLSSKGSCETYSQRNSIFFPNYLSNNRLTALYDKQNNRTASNESRNADDEEGEGGGTNRQYPNVRMRHKNTSEPDRSAISFYQILRVEEKRISLCNDLDLGQSKEFTNWINNRFISKASSLSSTSPSESTSSSAPKINKAFYLSLCVKDLYSDLQDGVRLVFLIEVLYEVRLKKELKVTNKLHRVKNFESCINYLKANRDIQCVGINAYELADNNLKMLLGFLFLIKRDYEKPTLQRQSLKMLKLRVANENSYIAEVAKKSLNPVKKSVTSDIERVSTLNKNVDLNRNRVDMNKASVLKSVEVINAKTNIVSKKNEENIISAYSTAAVGVQRAELQFKKNEVNKISDNNKKQPKIYTASQVTVIKSESKGSSINKLDNNQEGGKIVSASSFSDSKSKLCEVVKTEMKTSDDLSNTKTSIIAKNEKQVQMEEAKNFAQSVLLITSTENSKNPDTKIKIDASTKTESERKELPVSQDVVSTLVPKQTSPKKNHSLVESVQIINMPETKIKQTLDAAKLFETVLKNSNEVRKSVKMIEPSNFLTPESQYLAEFKLTRSVSTEMFQVTTVYQNNDETNQNSKNVIESKTNSDDEKMTNNPVVEVQSSPSSINFIEVNSSKFTGKANEQKKLPKVESIQVFESKIKSDLKQKPSNENEIVQITPTSNEHNIVILENKNFITFSDQKPTQEKRSVESSVNVSEIKMTDSNSEKNQDAGNENKATNVGEILDVFTNKKQNKNKKINSISENNLPDKVINEESSNNNNKKELESKFFQKTSLNSTFKFLDENKLAKFQKTAVSEELFVSKENKSENSIIKDKEITKKETDMKIIETMQNGIIKIEPKFNKEVTMKRKSNIQETQTVNENLKVLANLQKSDKEMVKPIDLVSDLKVEETVNVNKLTSEFQNQIKNKNFGKENGQIQLPKIEKKRNFPRDENTKKIPLTKNSHIETKEVNRNLTVEELNSVKIEVKNKKSSEIKNSNEKSQEQNKTGQINEYLSIPKLETVEFVSYIDVGEKTVSTQINHYQTATKVVVTNEKMNAEELSITNFEMKNNKSTETKTKKAKEQVKFVPEIKKDENVPIEGATSEVLTVSKNGLDQVKEESILAIKCQHKTANGIITNGNLGSSVEKAEIRNNKSSKTKVTIGKEQLHANFVSEIKQNVIPISRIETSVIEKETHINQKIKESNSTKEEARNDKSSVTKTKIENCDVKSSPRIKTNEKMPILKLENHKENNSTPNGIINSVPCFKYNDKSQLKENSGENSAKPEKILKTASTSVHNKVLDSKKDRGNSFYNISTSDETLANSKQDQKLLLLAKKTELNKNENKNINNNSSPIRNRTTAKNSPKKEVNKISNGKSIIINKNNTNASNELVTSSTLKKALQSPARRYVKPYFVFLTVSFFTFLSLFALFCSISGINFNLYDVFTMFDRNL